MQGMIIMMENPGDEYQIRLIYRNNSSQNN